MCGNMIKLSSSRLLDKFMNFNDFLKNHPPIKPYALMDLDDTLFQTKRKLVEGEFGMVVASVDKQGKALSFFTKKQAHFFHWLSTHTTLIPVTARDRAEIGRVKLPFDGFKVLTHGAVILDKNAQSLHKWELTIFEQLWHVQTALHHLLDVLPDTLTITPHTDEFLGNTLTIYIAIKHPHKDHQALSDFAQILPTLVPDFAQHFYVHVNANNLAILPHCIHKQHAVDFLKTHYLDSDIPCFGFGDSLADLPFLKLLDWYGTPNRGQLHQAINPIDC